LIIRGRGGKRSFKSGEKLLDLQLQYWRTILGDQAMPYTVGKVFHSSLRQAPMHVCEFGNILLNIGYVSPYKPFFRKSDWSIKNRNLNLATNFARSGNLSPQCIIRCLLPVDRQPFPLSFFIDNKHISHHKTQNIVSVASN